MYSHLCQSSYFQYSYYKLLLLEAVAFICLPDKFSFQLCVLKSFFPFCQLYTLELFVPAMQLEKKANKQIDPIMQGLLCEGNKS